MRVLIACEFSGIVREAFKAKGHDAWSCDLLPTEIPGQHIQDNILRYLNDDWDLMIAHPPCTFLANSGVCWLKNNKERIANMIFAGHFFKRFLECNASKVCIENPIMHKYAIRIIGKKYDQIVQPWMFGHTERKATCLWLKGLPKLKETNNVKEEMLKLPKAQQQRLHYLSPSPQRAHERSRTFKGIAQAMADQWG